MNGRVLLDTNIIIGLFAGDSGISKRISKAAEIFIPVVALGELHYGAYRSSRVKENHRIIDDFAGRNTVLFCNLETAKRYGEIKNYLKQKASPIPENDIWIAAISRQYGLALITKDAHFKNIQNLKLELL